MSARLPRANSSQSTSVIDVLDAKVRPKAISRRYDYWIETHRPLVCLVFTLPLLLWYEIGMVLHPDAIRSGIDRLLQTLLSPVGDTSLVVLPLVTIGAMLFLHHRRRDDAGLHLNPKTFVAMVAESLGLAVILFITCDALMLYLSDQQPKPLSGLATVFSDTEQYARVLTCVGAGIHEELLFRLLMFAPLMHWIRRGTDRERLALVIASVVVSLVFALGHCDLLNPEGTPFEASSFLFRFLASVFLCFLFRFRGIGIALSLIHI